MSTTLLPSLCSPSFRFPGVPVGSGDGLRAEAPGQLGVMLSSTEASSALSRTCEVDETPASGAAERSWAAPLIFRQTDGPEQVVKVLT